MVKLAPARDNPGSEIQNFLNADEVFGSAVPVYREAVADMWENEGGHDVRKSLGR